jgi:hypothetical protein
MHDEESRGRRPEAYSFVRRGRAAPPNDEVRREIHPAAPPGRAHLASIHRLYYDRAMDAPDQISDSELLFTLRVEYARALQQGDYARINRVIMPRFLERFERYYETYGQSWKDLSLSRPPVRIVIDPRQQEEIKMEWAGLVLSGEINPDV